MTKTLKNLAFVVPLILLLGCNQQQNTPLPPTASTVVIPDATPPAPDAPTAPPSKENVAFQDCFNASKDTKTVNANEQGLRTVQELVRCSESYLDEFPDGLQAGDAERLRHKSIVASMKILRAIEAQNKSANPENAGDVQKLLLSRKNIKMIQADNARYIDRTFQYHTIKSFWQLFQNLKDSGIQMDNAMERLNQANISRKRSGIWELSVDRSYDNGQFIVVRDISKRDPEFVVAGFGGFTPHVQISDTELYERGWFSEDCTFKISAEGRTLSYPCIDYLSGKANEEVVREMGKILAEAMRKKGSTEN